MKCKDCAYFDPATLTGYGYCRVGETPARRARFLNGAGLCVREGKASRAVKASRERKPS